MTKKNSQITSYLAELTPQLESGELDEQATVSCQTELRTATVEGLSSAYRYKATVRAINEIGMSSPETLYKLVDPADQLSPPEIESSVNRMLLIKAGYKITLQASIKGRPTPTVSWTKRVGEISQHAAIESKADSASLVIDEAKREDAGVYVLEAENSSGKVSLVFNVKVFATPSIVQNLTVTKIGRGFAVLNWEPPMFDGGSDIRSYVVEKREASRKVYHLVANVNKCSYKVTNLREGEMFAFRVSAVNEYGNGDGAETHAVRVSELPSPPQDFRVAKVTNKTVTLNWNPPAYDGGSVVTEYIVEIAKDTGVDLSWTVCGSDVLSPYEVNYLHTEENYKFRVRAKNAVGLSEARETGSVCVKEVLDSPTIDMSSFIDYTIVERAGTNFRLRVPITGKPFPSVRFEKADEDGAEVVNTKRVTVGVEGSYAALDINDLHRSDKGRYHIIAENSVGKACQTVHLVVTAPPSVPVGPLVTENINDETVMLQWQPPQDDGGAAVDHYTIEQLDAGAMEWKQIVCFQMKTYHRVSRLTLGKEYLFRVRAINKYGQSVPLTSEPVKVQHPFNAPNAPENIEIVKVSGSAVTLKWKKPRSDGGSSVTGYHVECKDVNSVNWIKANKFPILDTRFKCSSVENGLSYEFRVFAENLAGLSPSSAVSRTVCARDPIDPPHNLRVASIKSRSVCLKWKMPENDGGSLITSYLVEKLEMNRWSRCNLNNITDTEYEVLDLIHNWEYEFRVKAVNAAGNVSEPSKSTGTVKLEEIQEAPKLKWIEEYNEKMTAKADQNLEFKASFTGQPIPTVEWEKDGQVLDETSKISIRTTEDTTIITLRRVNRDESGVYTVKATNPSGTTQLQINLKVFDTPGPCQSPEIHNISSNKVTLVWKPPCVDGGYRITSYRLDKREAARLSWVPVSKNIVKLVHTVKNLRENGEFTFKLQAENKLGLGKEVIIGPIILKDDFSVPSAPRMPVVQSVSREGCVLSWTTPESDGGSEIIGYYVDRHDSKAKRWLRVNRAPAQECRLKAHGMIENTKQQFRVFAVNKAGLSEPSVETEPVEIKEMVYKPGSPESFKVTDCTLTSITVEWLPPTYNGGAHITHYSLEESHTCINSDDDYTEWVEIPTKLSKPIYIATGLSDDNLYRFRVFAHNEAGKSQPTILPNDVVPTNRHLIPNFGPDHLGTKTISVRSGNTIRIAVPMMGRPVPTPKWSRTTPGLEERATIENIDNITVLTIKHATRDDAGEYTLTIENDSGSASLVTRVKVLDSPGPPDQLKVTKITIDSVTISWKPPKADGGSAVTNYILEQREASRRIWQTVETACMRNSYKFVRLLHGNEYNFRVLAESENGVGDPAEITTPILVSEVPGKPESFTCTEITNTSVSLKWEKPLFDGGMNLLGYIVQQKLEDSDQWFDSMKIAASSKECTVNDLLENKKYSLRLRAINKVGASESAELKGLVLVSKQTAAPEISFVNKKLFECHSKKSLHAEFVVTGTPFPSIEWKRGDTVLELGVKYKQVVEDNLVSFVIKDTHIEETGNYSITAVNEVGSKTLPFEVKVFGRPSPPTGPVMFSEISAESVTVKWNAPSMDGGAVVTNYTLDVQDSNTLLWHPVLASAIRPTIKVNKLTRGLHYTFRIYAENRYGRSDCLQTHSVVTNYPFSVPDCPINVQVVMAAENRMKIEWEEPDSDGGNAITAYHVEMKDKNSMTWIKCAEAPPNNLWSRITNLQKGLEYEFRVAAENLAGLSNFSTPSHGAVARDEVGAPRDVVVTDVGRSNVALKWKVPEHDGGARIVGYNIEYKEESDGRWLRHNVDPIPFCEYDVDNLVEGKSYNIRVLSKNAFGMTSAPEEVGYTITPKHNFSAPRVDVDAAFLKEIVRKAGESIELRAEVVGKPEPTVSWQFNGEEFIARRDINIHYVDSIANVQLKSLGRLNTGTYKITAENQHGVNSFEYKLKVLDKPGPPEGPVVISNKSATQVTLSWKPPLCDGGSAVTSYSVEKRESHHLRWTLVHAIVTRTQCTIKKLVNESDYIFRIRAENKYGVGDDHLVSEEITTGYPFNAPESPNNLQVNLIFKDTVQLSWEKPLNDGGSPITGYMVEKKIKHKPQWVYVNRNSITEPRCKVSGLLEGNDYVFRVAAVNLAGVGEWCVSTSATQMQEPIFTPDRPHGIHVRDTSKSSITIRWFPPNFIGGSEIIGYLVEYCSLDSQDKTLATIHEVEVSEQEQQEQKQQELMTLPWIQANKTSLVENTIYTVQDLKSDTEYLFQVAAVNEAGTGPWVTLKSPVSCVERFEAPELVIDETVRRNIVVKAGGQIRLNIGYRGRPTPKVTWSKAYMTAEAIKERYGIIDNQFYTSLLADDVTREDAGKFVVSVENGYGSKEFVFNVKVLDTPGQVSNFRVSDVGRTHVTLKWVTPENDGGSYITNYVVQKREESRRAWTTVAMDVTRNTFKVMNLAESECYYFRIAAENSLGVGEFASLKEPVVVSTTPSAPGKLEVIDQSSSSVSLAWQKSSYDGGSPITGYTVEISTPDEDDWSHCVSVTACATVIKDLEEGKQYMFRVKAENEKGFSDVTELGTVVVAKEIVQAPEITFAELESTEKYVRAGKPIEIFATISGIPKPEVTWTKDETEYNSARTLYEGVQVTSAVHIRNCLPQDAGRYTITASNSAGKKTCAVDVMVLDKPGVVENLEVAEVTEDSISIVWKPPTHNGGSQVTNYFVQHKETDAELWIDSSASVVKPRIKVLRLKLNAEYMLRVAAENRYGIGKFSFVKNVTVKFPFGKPDCPGKPRITSVSFDSISFDWEAPRETENSPVDFYKVECKDVNSITWYQINRLDVVQTKFTATGLEAGLTYQFRVTAVNPAGDSQPSTESDETIARRIIGVPEDLEIVDFSRSNVSLEWREPENDGGAMITGYVVELRENDGKWKRWNHENVIDCKYDCRGLLEGNEYEFRIIAKNAAGAVSLPSETTYKIKCKNEVTLPKVEIESSQNITIKAGEIINMKGRVSGKPFPTVKWLHNNSELVEKAKVFITLKRQDAAVQIVKTTREDSGEYTLFLENEHGERSVPFKVTVLDTPGKPVGPLEVSDITQVGCRLTWRPPDNDGGRPISHYIVEKRETNRSMWSNVSVEVTETFIKVKRLVKNKEYVFRVKAVNKIGEGVPLESAPVQAKNPFTVPSAPGKPHASSINKSSLLLSWGRPESDGGNEITGYFIERKDKKSQTWVHATRLPVPNLHRKINDLYEGKSYQFRISAKNDAGVGPTSEISDLITCVEEIYPPGKASDLLVVDSSSNYVQLSWKPPIYDGGDENVTYKVEAQEKNTSDWCLVAKDITTLEYSADKLKPETDYMLRVLAGNKAGYGEPVTTEDFVTTVDKPSLPEILNEYDILKSMVVKAGRQIKLNIKFKGRPIPNVEWKKNEESIAEQNLNISTTDDESTLVISKCDRNNTGTYTVTLTNSSGSTSTAIRVRVLDTPGCCRDVRIKSHSSDFATLSWECPENDGGSEVNSYVVEKRIVGMKAWTSDNPACMRTSMKVSLIQGEVYNFRVSAENNQGIGEPVETVQPLKALGVPATVDNLRASDILPTSCRLNWSKPLYDGGSPVQKYLVEYRLDLERKWTSYKECEETTICVENLIENEEYSFRIFAINNIGKSFPCEILIPIKLCDTRVVPTFDTSQYISNIVHAKVGSNVEIKLPYTGKPKPTIKWYKNGDLLGNTNRTKLSCDDKTCSMKLSKVTSNDNCTYEVSAANEAGKTHAELKLVVLDKPGPVLHLKNKIEDETTISLKWKEPLVLGGTTISYYIVECRKVDELDWHQISSAVVGTTHR